MNFTPCASSGSMILPSGLAGRRFDAHHLGLAGPVDVGIQQTDPAALAGQRHGQVRRHGRLAHPALARGDRDDAGHARYLLRPALLRRRVAADLQAGRRRLGRRAMRRHHDGNLRHARQRGQRGLGLGLGRGQCAGLVGGCGLDHEADGGAARTVFDRQRANQVAPHQAAAAGQRNPVQNLEDPFARDGHSSHSASFPDKSRRLLGKGQGGARGC
jgi:hypothetical protein